jgi:hypothetical protein
MDTFREEGIKVHSKLDFKYFDGPDPGVKIRGVYAKGNIKKGSDASCFVALFLCLFALISHFHHSHCHCHASFCAGTRILHVPQSAILHKSQVRSSTPHQNQMNVC